MVSIHIYLHIKVIGQITFFFQNLKTVEMVSAVYKSKIGSRFKRRRKVQEEEEGGKVKVEMDESLCRGMADVLLQTNM